MSRRSRKSYDKPNLIKHICSRVAGKRGEDRIFMEGSEADLFYAHFETLHRFFAVDILGFTLMGNHFHLMLREIPKKRLKALLTPEEIKRRWRERYVRERVEGQRYRPKIEPDWKDKKVRADWRRRMRSYQSLVHDLQGEFAQKYNTRHDRRGALWAERFHMNLLNGIAAVKACLEYIDLNPVKAGLVEQAAQWAHGFFGQASKKLLGASFAESHPGRAAWLRSLRHNPQSDPEAPGVKCYLNEQFREEIDAALAEHEKTVERRAREIAARLAQKTATEELIDKTMQDLVPPKTRPSVFSSVIALGDIDFIRALASKFQRKRPAIRSLVDLGFPEVFALGRRC